MADKSVGVKITGARELRRAIRDTQDKDLKKGLRKVNKTFADRVSDRAQRIVPRRTGALADSIRGLGSQTKAQVAAGRGKTRDYAGRIHYGDPYGPIEGQPFIHEALADEWDYGIREYLDMLEDLGDQIRTTNSR